MFQIDHPTLEIERTVLLTTSQRFSFATLFTFTMALLDCHKRRQLSRWQMCTSSDFGSFHASTIEDDASSTKITSGVILTSAKFRGTNLSWRDWEVEECFVFS